MIKNILFAIFYFIIAAECAHCAILPVGWEYSPKDAEIIRNFITNKQYFNALYSNILGLDKKQREEFEKITTGYNKIYKEYTDKLIKETKKYRIMKENNLPLQDRESQKKEIKRIYLILKKNSRQEMKSLKHILNKTQLNKYRLIKHLETHDIKKESHAKNYYKSNPSMSKFGDPKTFKNY